MLNNVAWAKHLLTAVKSLHFEDRTILSERFWNEKPLFHCLPQHTTDIANHADAVAALIKQPVYPKRCA